MSVGIRPEFIAKPEKLPLLVGFVMSTAWHVPSHGLGLDAHAAAQSPRLCGAKIFQPAGHEFVSVPLPTVRPPVILSRGPVE